MSDVIKDSNTGHWVNRTPIGVRPYLQLSRLDRPVGYWLLALPGWIGLAFATLSHGYAFTDFKWGALILIGAIAMRGAGCTYNDIVDQDLDAQVERTALRPLPAGTITTKQAWIWLFAQCAVGLIVLLCLPRLAQIISLCSIPLVAAYPFMKRITWWPQVWLGMTFNWAVLVAYAAKTGEVSTPVLILYAGLIFWTIGYDTIYACQDIEDDGLVGIKSTARRFGSNTKIAIGICYGLTVILLYISMSSIDLFGTIVDVTKGRVNYFTAPSVILGYYALIPLLPFFVHLLWQAFTFDPNNPMSFLRLFKSNVTAALIMIFSIFAFHALLPYLFNYDMYQSYQY